jgi:hypothetical protein
MLRIAFLTIALCLLAGCAEDEGSGTLQVMLRAEDTITSGLSAGEGDDEVVDGWSVSFDTWIATVGHVHIDRTDGEAGAREAEQAGVFDLRSIPNSGAEVARFADIAAGRWDVFEYETPIADADAEPDDSVSDEDFAALIEADATYLIAGTLANEQGQSCPPGGECRDTREIRFSFAVPAETLVGPCSSEQGLAGAVVNEEGTTTVAITLHGDHIFFDAFPGMVETQVKRRAQWLADADLDQDDAVSREELESIDAADLLTSETHTLGGAPIPIDTAWDFVTAQLKTSGHFQGEGECPVDGAGHEH